LETKIIVLTPVKNEAWILDLFLKITSQFADHILLADQHSTDATLEIASKYAKVIVIENKNQAYDEAYRQQLLIEKARELFPTNKRIFIALDADEIISADGIQSQDWETIRSTPINTTLYFEKPDLYLSTDKTIRYETNFWPLGFVDDVSTNHEAQLIHSIRVPQSEQKVYLNTIKFLHLAYLRPNIQRAKFRFYTVKENVAKVNPWYRRRKWYRSPNHLVQHATVVETPTSWLNYTDGKLLDAVKDTNETWHNLNILENLQKHGSVRFWFDDIWDIDWQKYQQQFDPTAATKITPPPALLRFVLRLFDKIYQ